MAQAKRTFPIRVEKTAEPEPAAANLVPKKKRRKWPPGVVVKNGRWYVRLRYHEGGKRHAVWRECATNATAARDAREALRKEFREGGHQALSNSLLTFSELAEYFEKTYLVPAKFVGDRLVSGRRSLVPAKCCLKVLVEFFGSKPIRSITHGNLETLKRARLATPIVFKKKDPKSDKTIVTKRQRSITSVNKELALVRRMFNVAAREGWMQKNPFGRGDSLISTADESKRERILTREEEKALLALCVKPRAYLRPLIICAVDTGMRWGEMNKLRVLDLNFETRVITIVASHTKTMQKRRVRMTARVAEELQAVAAGKSPLEQIFQRKSVKKAWTTLRKAAGLEDLRWHDLRHTNATRIEKSKRVSAGQLQRHLGHADRRSTERYINQDDDAVVEISEALEYP